MATTIVSNLVVFADATGHGNQSHLVWAATQQRWWLFVTQTKTATVVSTYVSSGADLATATWSAGTDSSAFPGSNNLTATDQRQLGCIAFANGSTDVAHVSVGINSAAVATHRAYHARVTFTGAATVTWESWNTGDSGDGTAGPAVVGNNLGYSTTGRIHEVSCMLSADFANGYPTTRLGANVDTGPTWTTGFSSPVNTDSQTNFIASYAIVPLASDKMLMVYGNGAAAQPNTTGLRSNVYVSGSSWPTSGSVVTGNGTTSQDQNDWGVRAVDATHVFCVRRSGANTFDMQMYDGSNWGSKTAPPNQAHKAGSGIFLATDNTNLWMFVLDSAGNNAVMYCKYNVSGNSWGTWTQLEAAGATARNYISGSPTVFNNLIGVVFTAVNGANFDVVVTSLVVTVPPGVWSFQPDAFQYAVPGSASGSLFRPPALAGLGTGGPFFSDPLGA